MVLEPEPLEVTLNIIMLKFSNLNGLQKGTFGKRSTFQRKKLDKYSEPDILRIYTAEMKTMNFSSTFVPLPKSYLLWLPKPKSDKGTRATESIV